MTTNRYSEKVNFEQIFFNVRNFKRVSVIEEKHILIYESRVD